MFIPNRFVISALLVHKSSVRGAPSFFDKQLFRNQPLRMSSSASSSNDEKPKDSIPGPEPATLTYPEGYVVPAVWEPKTMGGKINGMNRPTAGKRFDSELPRGEHDLQLYSLGTPNGQKVTILLEELGLEYDAWFINILELQQFGSAFVDINPNSKIPALLDYSATSTDGDHPDPLPVWESASILLYLAEREGKFLPTDPRKRTECLNWLMWQMGTGPYLGGGFGHFYKYAPLKVEYAIDRFAMEAKRIVDVLERRLEGREYVCGDEYTIADMAIFPWMRCLDKGYNASEFLKLETYTNVERWKATLEAREAVKRGLRVNGFGPDAVRERHSADDFDAAAAAEEE